MRGHGHGGPPHGGHHHGGHGGPHHGGYHGGHHAPPPPRPYYRHRYRRYGGGCLGCCVYLLGAIAVMIMLPLLIF